MSRDHKGCIRGFHQSSRAWYARFKKHREHKELMVLADDNVPEVFNFGMYGDGGGSTSGSMSMVWEIIPEHGGFSLNPRLKCYDDGWSALASMMDLIVCMGAVDSQNITPDDFRKMLLERGFTDLTKEQQE